MRPYTQPDLNKSIETLQAEVRRDYEEMTKRFKLPKRLDFPHACKAVYAGGMGIRDGSPYNIFRNELLLAVTSTLKGDSDLQDILEILTGVWNHFPHSDLDGLSPMEKMRTEPAISDLDLGEISSLTGEKYATKVDEVVLGFSEAVAGNLLHYLKQVGLGKKEQQHILTILSNPEEEPEDTVMYLFTKMVEVAKKGKVSLTIDDLQPVVRALMWCENYTASKMPNGHWNSRMFQNIIEQAMDFNTVNVTKVNSDKEADDAAILIADPLRVWEALSMIHDAISEFCDDFNVDLGIEEATRHLVDWLAHTDIHELLSREDLNLTTLHFIGAARLIAITGDPKRHYKRLEKNLHKEITSQVGLSEYEREIKRIAEKALNATQDPIMLMPYPGQEPDNCLERLAKLAPSLKLRTQVDDDLSFIPSPFFP